MQYRDLTTGSLREHIRFIAVPASVGFFFNTMFNVIDTYFAGEIGTAALAGLAISFPVYILLIALSSGIGNAVSALSSISLGKKDNQAYHTLMVNSLFLSVIIGIILVLFSSGIVDGLFQLTGATGDAFELGTSYTRTIFYGSVFFTVNYAINGMLSAQGDTKSYRNFLIIGFFLNIILDPLFIFGWFGLPQLGTVGIALATVLVQAIGTLYLGYRLLRSNGFVRELFLSAKIAGATILEILRQAIPSALSTATVAIGVFVINYFVVQYGGEATIAAYGVSLRIEQIVLLPTIGLNTAALTIIGQNYGAKNFNRMQNALKLTLRYGLIIVGVGALIVFTFAPTLIGLFDNSQDVIQAGTNYLRIATLVLPAYIFLYLYLSALQAIKKPNFGFYIGLFRQLFPIVLFQFLASTLNLGIFGVWWGIVIKNWVAVIITIWYTRRQFKAIENQRLTPTTV